MYRVDWVYFEQGTKKLNTTMISDIFFQPALYRLKYHWAENLVTHDGFALFFLLILLIEIAPGYHKGFKCNFDIFLNRRKRWT